LGRPEQLGDLIPDFLDGLELRRVRLAAFEELALFVKEPRDFSLEILDLERAAGFLRVSSLLTVTRVLFLD
jgi:hypothetical protein